MKYEFGLTNISIEDYEHGTVKRLLNRCGKIGLDEIIYQDNNKYYRYVLLVERGKETLAEDIITVLTNFDII